MGLLQTKFRPKRIRVHHEIQKDGNNVGYLSKEPRCTPQIFGGSTPPSACASDVVQTQIGGPVLCIGTVLGKNRPEESVIKWIKAKEGTRHF